MPVEIKIQNNKKFSITQNQFLPADYTLIMRVQHDENLVSFIVQNLQNILISNNIPVTIGGDAIGQ